MAKKDAYWLAWVLVVTPWVLQSCSGDDSTPGTATGTAATGGSSTGTAGTGGSGTTGSGGSSGGTGGTGMAGSGGSGTADASGDRMGCGTANPCSTNPSSNNICDLPNSRCVDCMTDMDCAVEPTNPHCDTRPNTAGLPAYSCEECIDNTHCPAGAMCVNGDCESPCGTTTCETNEVCDAPNNRCVDCLGDTDCADETTDKHCDLTPNTAGLPSGSCEECVDASHCVAGEICVNNNCEPTCTTDANCSADGGGNNPYCHPTTKICAECATDAQCAGNTGSPYCTADGDCEECVTDAHCTNPMQPFCDDDECVACRTSADCTAPMTCNNQGNCATPTMDGGRGGG
ncbi:MAG TPA: hypothetical protein VK540_06625 [Polyangiaceae bacterium]|nr:hypothetical protein [Polyangiaceae bacterium]